MPKSYVSKIVKGSIIGFMLLESILPGVSAAMNDIQSYDQMRSIASARNYLNTLPDIALIDTEQGIINYSDEFFLDFTGDAKSTLNRIFRTASSDKDTKGVDPTTVSLYDIQELQVPSTFPWPSATLPQKQREFLRKNAYILNKLYLVNRTDEEGADLYYSLFTTDTNYNKNTLPGQVKGNDGVMPFVYSWTLDRYTNGKMANHSMQELSKIGLAYAPYTDIKKDAWYAKDLGLAQTFNLVKGYSDGTFKPGASVSRVEFMIMIANATFGETNFKAIVRDEKFPAGSGFSDSNIIKKDSIIAEPMFGRKRISDSAIFKAWYADYFRVMNSLFGECTYTDKELREPISRYEALVWLSTVADITDFGVTKWLPGSTTLEPLYEKGVAPVNADVFKDAFKFADNKIKFNSSNRAEIVADMETKDMLARSWLNKDGKLNLLNVSYMDTLHAAYYPNFNDLKVGKSTPGYLIQDSVLKMASLGIVNGDEKGNLNGWKDITRAEATSLLVRTVVPESRTNQNRALSIGQYLDLVNNTGKKQFLVDSMKIESFTKKKGNPDSYLNAPLNATNTTEYINEIEKTLASTSGLSTNTGLLQENDVTENYLIDAAETSFKKATWLLKMGYDRGMDYSPQLNFVIIELGGKEVIKGANEGMELYLSNVSNEFFKLVLPKYPLTDAGYAKFIADFTLVQ